MDCNYSNDSGGANMSAVTYKNLEVVAENKNEGKELDN